MAGTLVVTTTNARMNAVDFPTKHAKVTLTWTSDASGDVTGNIAESYNSNLDRLKGWIVKITTNPGATAPTDNYDITLSDGDSVDICNATLMNRDTATSETVTYDPPIWVDSELALVIANAGNVKGGVIEIYMVGHYI
jgi:hypothetical protein